MDIIRAKFLDRRVLDQTPQGGHLFLYEMYKQSSWFGIRIFRDGQLLNIHTGKEKYIDKLWKEKTKGASWVPSAK